MSRAFVSENTTEAGNELPELPISPHPNYVTPAGLAALQERLAAARDRRQELRAEPEGPQRALAEAHLEREIRWLEARVEGAILVDTAAQPKDEVAFGAIVEVAEPGGAVRRYAIVGEDEADAAAGKVSWVSPLARALIGAGVGDTVVWKRSAGEVELEIRAVRYPR
jgi:transcription elongation GreA/GreB family factor